MDIQGQCEQCGRSGFLGRELFTYYVADKLVALLCVPETGRDCAKKHKEEKRGGKEK